MDIAIPITGLASMALALLDFRDSTIIYIGGLLTVLNFVLLYIFDDTGPFVVEGDQKEIFEGKVKVE